MKQHVTSLSAVTVSLPQAGARVAYTRDAAKSAAEVAAAAVASVMKAKAELHRFASILLMLSPGTRFLPQPPGRCQCRWQGRRRRVQGGVAHSSAAALLRSPFLQADIAAKVKVVEAAAAGVCGLCSYAPLSASCPCAAEVAVVARRL